MLIIVHTEVENVFNFLLNIKEDKVVNLVVICKIAFLISLIVVHEMVLN